MNKIYLIGFVSLSIIFVGCNNGSNSSHQEIESNCNCRGDSYNCSDFSTHREAQDYFDCCMEKTGKDVSKLDRDKDYSACETLP